jgi:hypothetical protein
MTKRRARPRHSSLLTLGLQPSQPGAARRAPLRFVRDLQVRSLLPSVAMFVLVVLWVRATWAILTVGATLIALLADIACLTFRLARDGSRS